MQNFVKFDPILKQSPEDILSYYQENNLELPDNKYLLEYLSPVISTKQDNVYNEIPREKYSTFKTSKEYLPKKKTNEKEWPIVDKTISNLVEESTAHPNKLQFLKEISELNLNNEDSEFLTKLAEKESSFRPNVINQLGYRGYYQFGKQALVHTGFKKEDLKDPKNQHIAALKLADLNMIHLKKYVGKVVNGIELTKNAIRAAAHLAGASGFKDWVEGTKKSNFAKRGFVDANGTHITKYLKEFA